MALVLLASAVVSACEPAGPVPSRSGGTPATAASGIPTATPATSTRATPTPPLTPTPAPTASGDANLSPSPSSDTGTKPGSETDTRLVGWRGGFPLLVATSFTGRGTTGRLMSLDLDTGTWSSGPGVQGAGIGLATTDGRSVLIAAFAPEGEIRRRLLFVSPQNEVRTVAFPAAQWVSDWEFWGDMAPMPRGGYVFTRTTVLATITDGGVLSVARIPAGYVVQAATSDPDRFLLGRLTDEDSSDARSPFVTGLFLWGRRGGSPTPIVRSALAVTPAGDQGAERLAWIQADDGRWLGLARDGRLVPVGSAVPDGSSISPDGTLVAVVPDRGDARCADTGPSSRCHGSLVETGSGREVAVLPGPRLGPTVWSGPRLAYETAAPDAGPDDPPGIVVADPAGVRRFAPP